MDGNREYKSDVFSMLMEDKENALSLYNAMNDSHYTDADMVEMKTLDRGISLTVRNDAAFVVDACLSVYEHQSSVCPNMPVRCLIYFTNILADFLKKRYWGVVKVTRLDYTFNRQIMLEREEGREEGREDTLLASIRSLMDTMDLTSEQAMDALRVSDAEREKFNLLLTQKPDKC